MAASSIRLLLAALLFCGISAPLHPQERALVPPPLLAVRGAESPIRLESLEMRTAIAGGFARTTVDLVFRNPNGRQLEGELQFPLQPSQQIQGFALDIDGDLRPAVPVPKARGRQVFEAVERRRVDPALLEKTVGNHFKLRIYPIPARGTRHVRLELSQAMRRDTAGLRLDLPLHLAETVDAFSLRITTPDGVKPRVTGSFADLDFKRGAEGYTALIERKAFRPSTGLSLLMPLPNAARAYAQALGGDHYFFAEVPVASSSAARTMPKTVVLLWDSSASASKRDIGSEMALLDRYFAALVDAEVRLIRLRDRPEAPIAFRVRGGAWPELKAALRTTAYDGASALADWPVLADADEYVLVSDGLINYGKRTFPQLDKRQRLYVLNSAGAAADDDAMAALAEVNGGRLVRWRSPAEIDAAARRLLQDGPRLLGMDAVGAQDLTAETRDTEEGVLRVAGKLTSPEATLSLTVRDAGRERMLRIPVSSRAPQSDLAGRLWASYKIRELSAQPDAHRKEIERLGGEFGIVTSETSLIVLDAITDYAEYGIAPPARYRAEYERLRSERDGAERKAAGEAIESAVAGFEQRIAWWEKQWPKGPLPAVNLESKEEAQANLSARRQAQPMPAPAPIAADAASLDSVVVTGERAETVALMAPGVADDESAVAQAAIVLRPWQPDSPYAARLRAAPADRVYAVYLDERAAYATSSAFYLDAADVLIEKGQRELALRVLSNLAEMDLENRHVLRILGYRLMQADAPELAVPVFEQVLRWGEEEPQSFRDLGLAYAAVGRDQDAVDMLYEIPSRHWDGRFPGIDQTALAELNAVVAKAGDRVDARRIDPRLLRNLPLDLRAVLSWDSDNSDMDLWVTDPNGEKCFYGHRATYQGGAMSADFTGGYGPEEFVLRDAKPGKYKVEANFFGDRQQIVTGATTLQLQLTTGFGSPQQRDQRVTMRLKDKKETILVGEFVVD
ncbi:DUF2135 domain-containing protein [Luteimonas gilva]|uniref:DUF2135 domain-containing protein n=1 Tax=Luteimonas gilva TaxID=2572684 RepID=A0A4U5JYC9_9GAMM|nr:VIT domain-containing protein [Luteimonas gilva]TKR33247.1 DUF2135 domain-containing protein [Luteimonas gilva]